MLRNVSTSLIVRGVLSLVLGVVAIVWPGITVGAFVVLFAVFAFADALSQGGTAFASSGAGAVIGHLLLALLDVAAGVVALVWPGITAYALVIWVGAWALVTGVVEVAAGFQHDEVAGERAMWIIAGLASVLFGLVVFAHPRAGALSLSLLFGFFALVVGFVELAAGINLRRGGTALRSMMRMAA
jgi:uncharacterized membrane protein HdeD (DUF308 family)